MEERVSVVVPRVVGFIVATQSALIIQQTVFWALSLHPNHTGDLWELAWLALPLMVGITCTFYVTQINQARSTMLLGLVPGGRLSLALTASWFIAVLAYSLIAPSPDYWEDYWGYESYQVTVRWLLVPPAALMLILSMLKWGRAA